MNIELPTVVVAGHLCLDIIPQIDHLPEGRLAGLLQPGHLVNIGAAAITTGGPVSNTGLALHKLGIPVRLIAKVGDDPFGQTIRALIDSYGPRLSDGIVTDSTVGSSYTLIISPPGIDRIFWHSPAANDAFCAADVDYNLVTQAALLHFGYPSVMRRMAENDGEETVELFRRAKAAGVTTSLDLSFPDPDTPCGRADWRKILTRVLPFVDIFAPSIDELLFMLDRTRYEDFNTRPGGLLEQLNPGLLADVSAELISWGVAIALIKTGHRGAYLYTAGSARIAAMGRATPADSAIWADRQSWQPCFQVQVVGTTGSGDATIAGFLAAFIRGLDPEAAMSAAVAVGACSVEAADALSGLRTWEETLSRIKSWGRTLNDNCFLKE